MGGDGLSGGVLLMLIGAVIATRRLPLGVLAPCAVLLLGVWGQALLLIDVIAPGTAVYLVAVLAAAALGWWRPMRRAARLPRLRRRARGRPRGQLAPDAGRSSAASSSPSASWRCSSAPGR